MSYVTRPDCRPGLRAWESCGRWRRRWTSGPPPRAGPTLRWRSTFGVGSTWPGRPFVAPSSGASRAAATTGPTCPPSTPICGSTFVSRLGEDGAMAMSSEPVPPVPPALEHWLVGRAAVGVSVIHCAVGASVGTCGVMVEHPERWTARTPAPRHLFDRAPTFGLARDAERPAEEVPAARTTIDPRKPPRERGPFLSALWLPWSYGDRDTGDRWHRMKCRRRHHEMGGGYTVQLGGTVVFIDRRCRWCGAEAGAV